MISLFLFPRQLSHRASGRLDQSRIVPSAFKLTLMLGLSLSMWPLCAAGQSPANGQRTELGVRQKLVQRKMVELEAKFTIVSQRIREKDAKRADLLIETYQQSKERSLTKKMENVSQLLNQQQYDAADQELNEVVDILESLIRMLTNEKEKKISTADEIAMLEAFKNDVQQRLKEQQQQTRDTETATNKEQASERVQAQIKALNRLIDSQKEIVKETAKNQSANLKKLDNIADKQFEIRQQTDRLRNDIGGLKKNPNEDNASKPLADSNPDGPSAAGQQRDDGEPTSEQSTQSPSDSQRNTQPDTSDLEPKSSSDGRRASPERSSKNREGEEPAGGDFPADQSENNQSAKKSAGQSPDPSTPESGSPASSPDAPSPSAQQPDGPPQPGQQALQKSADHQQRAEEKLGSGKPADARDQQEMALDELENALAELEKEKRRIDSLPPEILEQLAKEQRRNRDKTLDIVKAMEQSPSGEQPQDAPQSESGSPPQQPGQQQMQQAGDAQQKAADNMQQNQGDVAQQQQKKAEQKMQQAIEEIESRLSQLREETNAEKLARLEARFKEMLDRQIVASVMTTEIEDKRSNLGQFRLRDQLLILRLATEELEIRERGQQAYDLLLEEGKSIVFPEVIQDLRTDLQTASSLLQSERTDQYTQLVQKEIEITIQDLLEAVKTAKQDQQQNDSKNGSSGGGGDQPLLKKSAELKMLRMRQRRLNRRTKKLEIMRDSPDMKAVIEKEVSEAATMQKKILEMTDNILKKK